MRWKPLDSDIDRRERGEILGGKKSKGETGVARKSKKTPGVLIKESICVIRGGAQVDIRTVWGKEKSREKHPRG